MCRYCVGDPRDVLRHDVVLGAVHPTNLRPGGWCAMWWPIAYEAGNGSAGLRAVQVVVVDGPDPFRPIVLLDRHRSYDAAVRIACADPGGRAVW